MNDKAPLEIYEKRQLGWAVILLFVAVDLVLLLVAFLSTYWVAIVPLAALFAMALMLFYSLSVRVDRRAVTLTYGIGVIHKRIEFSSISAARVVKSPFYYGYGIRQFPGGVMYSIAGPCTVELQLTSGGLVRVGTAEPELLLRALLLHHPSLNDKGAGPPSSCERQGS